VNALSSLKQKRTSPLSTPRAKNIALLLLAMTQFVIVIDASIVNVALPSIGSHLHFSRDDLSWVVNSYTLTFGGFLLLGGRMADLLGRRLMFMLGLLVFSLASFAGGIAQSEGWLITARAVQGLGAAIVSPAALSIITTTFADGPERNRALGIWGAVAGAGGAAGVLPGGSSPAGSAGAGCCSSTSPSASARRRWHPGCWSRAGPTARARRLTSREP
jgi:MFS family permease